MNRVVIVSLFYKEAFLELWRFKISDYCQNLAVKNPNRNVKFVFNKIEKRQCLIVYPRS